MGMYFRVEQRFGHLGIPGLVRILAFFKLITWVLLMMRGDRGAVEFWNILVFDLEAIYGGQIWRLGSFLILPASMNMIFMIFEVIFLFMIGDSLEQAWGPFGVTLYYFSSVFFGIAVCLLLSLGIRYPGLSNLAIYASLVMAAGFLYPDTIIQLYLIIPVKLLYIGLLSGFAVLWNVFVIAGNGLLPFLGLGLPLLACLIPFCVVFVPGFIKGAKHRSKVASRRSRFEQAKLPETDAFHRCDECNATEVSHPDRDFRITADDRELCSACRDASGNAGEAI